MNTEHAFPVSTIDGFTQHGMTKREYFAAHALAGLLANPDAVAIARVNAKGSQTKTQVLTELSVELSDALLVALSNEAQS